MGELSDYERRERRSNFIGYVVRGIAFVLVLALCNEPYQGGGCPAGGPLFDTCVPDYQDCVILKKGSASAPNSSVDANP